MTKQLIYLDFDGAETTYNNKDLNLSIKAKIHDSGMSEEQKQIILSSLNEKYKETEIYFSLEKPEEEKYSTIYIGQSDDFDEYGSFNGLAETIDKGNKIKDDDAFVFADSTYDTDTVISVINHEVGHITKGEEHEIVNGNLDDYAANYHMYGAVGTFMGIEAPATITGTITNNNSLTLYNFSARIEFSITTSGYYTVKYNYELVEGFNAQITSNICSPTLPTLYLYKNENKTIYMNAGETYNFYIYMPATNSNISVYDYTFYISPQGGGNPSNPPAPSGNPDLTISSFSLSPTYLAENKSLTIHFTIKNEGDSTASSSTVYVYNNGKIIKKCDIGSLAAGASIEKSVTIAPGTLSVGRQSFYIVADAEDDVSESDEKNNTSSTKTIKVVGAEKPDLTFYTPDNWDDKLIISTQKNTYYDSAIITTDDEIFLDFAVENQGQGDTSSSVYVDVYVDDVKINHWLNAAGLDANESYSWIDKSIGKLSAGTHTIKLQIRQDASETQTNNNTYSKTVTVIPKETPKDIDLTYYNAWGNKPLIIRTGTMQLDQSDEYFYYDQDIKLQFAVQNTGADPAENFYVSILVDGITEKVFFVNALSEDAEEYYAEDNYSIIGNYMYVRNCNIGKLSAGYHTIQLKIDYYSAIEESNENNNSYSTSIYVSGASSKNIDLTVSDIILSKNSFSASEDIEISFTVANIGSCNANFVRCAIYDGDTNLTYGEIDTFLDFDSLIAGESKTLSFKINAGTLSQGNHTLKIKVDSLDTYDEKNESNNTSYTYVNIIPPDTEPPTIPQNITYSEKNNVIYFYWDASTDNDSVAGYEFRYIKQYNSSRPNFSNATVISSETSSVSIKNLSEGNYYYQIRAIDSAGNYSDWSGNNYTTFKVYGNLDNTLDIPSEPKYSFANNSLILSWDHVSAGQNGGGYQIVLKNKKNGTFSDPITVYANKYVLKNPENYTSWKVRTLNSQNKYSQWSEDNNYNIFKREYKQTSIFLSFSDDYNETAVFSFDNFKHSMTIDTNMLCTNIYGLPQGICQIKAYSGNHLYLNDEETVFSPDAVSGIPEKFVSYDDGGKDVFFGNAKGKWTSGYSAQHSGSFYGWQGTGEKISLVGKNKITDIFEGSAASNVLVLTDDANGDAIFIDDVYSDSFNSLGCSQARFSMINEIRAGAGDDIIDMTSQNFEYNGDSVFIYGGDGNDVIWGNNSSNYLFGDAGNDRIIGGANNDIIIGGSGNDKMLGGGGIDIFTFSENWGNDTVAQLATGTVILWFKYGSVNNWNNNTLTYKDGNNTVSINGIDADQVYLYFGDEDSYFTLFSAIHAFDDFATEKIFEDADEMMLA